MADNVTLPGEGSQIATGSADADATATTAGAVVGDLFYA